MTTADELRRRTEGLNRYEVGDKLRELRQRERMSLSERSSSATDRVGVSRGPRPLLSTPGGRTWPIVRRGERQQFPERPDAEKHRLTVSNRSITRRPEGKLSAYLAEFESMPPDQVQLHRHEEDDPHSRPG